MFDTIKNETMKLSVEAFESLLPYRVYDEKNGVFINTGSIMKLFEMPILSGANDALIRDFFTMVNRHLNTEIYVQFIRYTHRQIQARLTGIQYGTENQAGIFGEMGKMQHDYYQYAASYGFPNRLGLPAPLMDSRVFVVLSLQSHRQDQDKKIDELNQLANQITVDLQTAKIPIKWFDQGKLLSLLRSWCAHDSKNRNFDESFNDVNYLNEQVMPLEESVAVETDHLVYVKNDQITKVGVFSVNKYPEQFALWQNADLIAHIDRQIAVTSPHLISVTFKLMSDENAKSLATRNFFHFDRNANSPLIKLFPKLGNQRNEWEYIRNSLNKEENKLCLAHYAVVLFSDKDHYASEVAKLIGNFRASGFEMTQKSHIQLPLFLSLLPGMMAQGMWQDMRTIRMVRRFTTWNIVNLLPIVGEWKGAQTGIVMPSMRNQLCTIDIFSKDLPTDNHNFCVAATSGAGKSVLVQALLFNVLADNGYVYIIDKGGSYKKICELLGGVYLHAKNIQLNPFTYLDAIKDTNDKNLYFSVIQDLLATLASPNHLLDDVSKAYLLEAIEYAYLKNQSKTCIDDVIFAIKALHQEKKKQNNDADNRLEDLVTLLKKYAKEGIFGQYFNGYSQLDPKAHFIVLEMDGLESAPDLKQAVMFSLINMISQRMYLMDRSIKKLCLIDEAWDLMTGDNAQAGKFIERGFRTSRKHGGAFGTITQGIDDYFKDHVSQACWASADTKWILRQNPENLKTFLTKNPGFFTPYEEHMLSQFHPAADSGYSSIMLKVGGMASFNRLFLPPFSKILFSTKADEFQLVEDLQKNHECSLSQAVSLAAEHFYREEVALLDKFSQTMKNEK